MEKIKFKYISKFPQAEYDEDDYDDALLDKQTVKVKGGIVTNTYAGSSRSSEALTWSNAMEDFLEFLTEDSLYLIEEEHKQRILKAIYGK